MQVMLVGFQDPLFILDPSTFQKNLNRNVRLHSVCILSYDNFSPVLRRCVPIYIYFLIRLRMHLFIVGHEFNSFLVNFFL